MTSRQIRLRSHNTKYLDVKRPFASACVRVWVVRLFSPRMFEMASIKRLNSLELLAMNEAHFSNS